jgi:hypothetical protein
MFRKEREREKGEALKYMDYDVFEQILAAAGRTSVDRSSKATLPLTVPGGAFKSSAKDLSVRPFVFAVELLLR